MTTDKYLTLSGYFGRQKELLVGRDTTGLILLIDELTSPGGRVILPAMCCMTRLASVLQAGRTPVVVDVDENMGMDPDRLAAVARAGDVVVAVHLFGIPCDIHKIIEVCNAKKCALIEDASQAIGAMIDDKPAGSFGNASILSFADRKILPTNGGGAIVVNDESLHAKLGAAVEHLSPRPANYEARKSGMHEDIKVPFDKARSGDTIAAAAWGAIYKKYGDIYYFSIEKEEAGLIKSSVDNFSRTVENRRDMVYLLRKKMSGSNIKFLDYPINSAPWRFSFILSENMTGADVVQAVKTLRENGVDASSLYLPLHWLAPAKAWTEGCPVAEHAGVRIVNIRVDETTTWEDANKAGHLVHEHTR